MESHRRGTKTSQKRSSPSLKMSLVVVVVPKRIAACQASSQHRSRRPRGWRVLEKHNKRNIITQLRYNIERNLVSLPACLDRFSFWKGASGWVWVVGGNWKGFSPARIFPLNDGGNSREGGCRERFKRFSSWVPKDERENTENGSQDVWVWRVATGKVEQHCRRLKPLTRC